jgi:hypothetical protein
MHARLVVVSQTLVVWNGEYVLVYADVCKTIGSFPDAQNYYTSTVFTYILHVKYVLYSIACPVIVPYL